MITGDIADVLVQLFVAGREHQDAALLHRMALRPGLEVALFERPHRGLQCFNPQSAGESALKTGGLVCGRRGIREQREGELLPLFEGFGCINAAVSDGVHFGSLGADLIHYVAQLRDLRFAEQSTKVTNKNQNRGLLSPETPEDHRLLLCIERSKRS
jgi:hypothetical protein